MRNLTDRFKGRTHRGCRYLQTLADAGIDCALYGRLIQQFTNHRLPNQAKQLHARLNLLSVVPDNFLGSKLVNVYAKTGNLSYARHVFDKIPQKNTFAYNAMLIAYSLNDRHGDALTLFTELAVWNELQARPNNYSITSFLKSLGSLPSSDVKVGKEVHGYIIRNELGGDVFVRNALISYYAKCVAIVLAKKVFDEMPHRDVVTWNSMIAGYSQGAFYEKCKELYREMLDSSGLMPNAVTVVSVLQACAQSFDLVLGMEVHRFFIDNQIQVDREVNNAFIAMYSKCGLLEFAKELFLDTSDRDNVTYGSIITGYMCYGLVDEAIDIFRSAKKSLGVSSWNAVISGLVQNNRCAQVIELLREMVASGLRPNQVTLSSILPALSYFSNLRGGKEVHCYAVKYSYDKNIYVTSAIIDIYGKTGYINGAEIVFRFSKEQSLVLWTALISAHSSQGDADSTLLLFYEMLDKGIEPDPVTFTAVLSACAHSGMVEKSWEVFNSMSREFGIQPLVEQYACMTTVLCRAGRLTEATEFVSSMPIKPSPQVWGALLHGASESGDVELAKMVYDRLCVDEPENSGNYTIMSNLYAQAGRWKEVDEVRDKMSGLGLKKIPGCSSVGTGIRLNYVPKVEREALRLKKLGPNQELPTVG